MVKINYKIYEHTQRHAVHATVTATCPVTEHTTKQNTNRGFSDSLTFAVNERLFTELET